VLFWNGGMTPFDEDMDEADEDMEGTGEWGGVFWLSL
jgi:hypothetical protein